jgi:long-subunit acyl-CoA synthetase (AMP-forming)
MERLIARIRCIAESQPQKIALRDETTTVCYKDLCTRIDSMAQWLRTVEIQRIGLYRDNDIEWIVTDLAAFIAGKTLVPLPTFFSSEQLAHVIAVADLGLILTANTEHTNTEHTIAACFPWQTCESVTKHSFAYWLPSPLADTGATKNCVDQADSTITKITFTSGSTGTPKGVCLTAATLMSVSLALAERLQNSEAVSHISLMPLSTLLENIAGVYVPLFLGMEISVLRSATLGISGSSGVDIAMLIKQLNHIQPDTMILLPQLLTGITLAVEAGLEFTYRPKFIAVGGGKVAAQLINKAAQLGLPVCQGYGLSECASVVCLNVPTDKEKTDHAGSVGKPLSHVQVRIRDEEVQVKGCVMSHYLHAPSEEIFTADGWLKTGDSGYFDAAGNLFISGRIKNIIVSSFGRNITPEWVESEVLANLLFSQCVLVGEARPFCIALLSLRHTHVARQVIEAAIERINGRLPDYARIGAFYVLDQPLSPDNGLLTTNGRPRREVIQQRFSNEIAALYAAEKQPLQMCSSHLR